MGNISEIPASFKISIKERFKIYQGKVDMLLEKLKLPDPLKNKYVIAGIIAAVIILIIIFSSGAGNSGDIPTYKIKRGNFLVTISESGEIRAKNSLSIMAPRIRGNLKIVFLIAEGTKVKPGDVVCKFDPSEAITNLRDAESKLEIALSDKDKLVANQKASMAQAESQLKSAELSFELSKLKLDQVKFEAQAIQQQTKLEHEKNRLSYEQTKQEAESKKIINKSEMDKMDIEIKQRRSDLDKAQKDLEQLTLTAPAEGLVVYGINWGNNGRKFGIGDTPWSGAQIITLPDLSAMESVTNINEVDVSKIKTGLKAVVRLDAFQDSSFTGVVNSVASIGRNKDQESNIKVFEVLLTINERSEILKPGMTSSNKIIINEIPDKIFVPLESVFEKNGKKLVYVKNGSGFDEREVETAEKGEDYIVVNKGVSNGEEVALIDPEKKPDAGTENTKQGQVSVPDAGK